MKFYFVKIFDIHMCVCAHTRIHFVNGKYQDIGDLDQTFKHTFCF